MYCLFMGCTQRGVLTTEERCPECGRSTSGSPPPASRPVSTPAGVAVGPVGRSSWRTQAGQRLAQDAARVGDILVAIAWLAVAVGALAGIVLLVGTFAASQPVAGLISVAAVGVSAAGAWSFLMLGSVVARYVALRSDGI